jgi:uncharacterized protein (DUF2236 family)
MGGKPANSPFFNPVRRIQGELVGRVREVFNDRAKGEQPVIRSDNALFPRNSVIWRVHGDVTSMMVGGMAALLLQMLHPAALTAVLDHSHFRSDMLGRLRRTAKFIALTTYGDRTQAEAAIDRVRSIHAQVTGTLADGTPYRADDPRLLAWVHTAEALCFLDAWIAYGEPNMSVRDQTQYFVEAAVVARRLGADPVPESRSAALAFVAEMRPELRATPACLEVAQLIVAPKTPNLGALAIQRLLAHASIDLLPVWTRDLLNLGRPGPDALITSTATRGMAATLRWAFSSQR